MQSTEAATSERVSTPVDRYLLICLYLMVMTGFGTIAATGQLDLASVLFVTAALAWRGYLLLIYHNPVIPESWNTRLALGFVLFYLVDVLLVSRSFLTATVHLVLCGLVVKIFSPLRDRDYVLLSALSFAMVLAASALTVDSAFFLMFCVFLLMAVATFLLLQMHRAAAQPAVLIGTQDSSETGSRLGASLAVITPAILLLILAGASGIFFLLPRVTSGYAGSFSAGNDLSTGFSNEVHLGSIGEIQQSQAVVMHVKVESGVAPVESRWRGVALSSFDGATWTNAHQGGLAERLPDGRFLVAQEAAQQIPVNERNLLRYRVLLEPLSSNVFFLAEQPFTVSGNYRSLGIDAGGAVVDLDREHPITMYEGESDSTRPSLAELRASSLIGVGVPRAYLQLPDLDPRIPELAREVTNSAGNNYDRAAALSQYLRGHYGYTLHLPTTAQKDPLANFLFERKEGHCEYFASSMTVMLRTLGIPSRVVNGFRGGEFNDLSGQYIVRASDAHSWVEVYFPGQGWVGFDPTPASSMPSTRGAWNRVAQYLDAMSSFWREWIVNYDFAHQRSLGEDGARRGRALFDGLKSRVMARYESLLRFAHAASRRTDRMSTTWLRNAAALVCLLLILGAVTLLRRWGKSLTWRRRPGSAPGQSASAWYGRMTLVLNKSGWQKAPERTAAQFVEEISDARIRESVDRFTRHYERARFAESGEDAELLPKLYEDVRARTRQARN
jgi:transglutaminase-like putative cysteine protease